MKLPVFPSLISLSAFLLSVLQYQNTGNVLELQRVDSDLQEHIQDMTFTCAHREAWFFMSPVSHALPADSSPIPGSFHRRTTGMQVDVGQ